ncbi:FmdB family zinc ribbon protein [Thiocapsa sp. UBA6158]|uniref:FmdB family zinc ribbon protein n=1 Tax=Thiocapsa sp. UBA6158 TaxID=1947692 RepID=UPI0039C988D5
MPIYDYRCTCCQTSFERSQSMNAEPPSCPACGGTTARVFLCAPAVHGRMARGRDQAVRSLQPADTPRGHQHGAGCGCGHS